MRFFLEWADVALILAGAVWLTAWLVRWQAAGGTDPLHDAPRRPNRMSALLLWFCLLGYLVGGGLGRLVADRFVPETLPENVREAWQGVLGAISVWIVVLTACLIVARVAFVDGWRGWGLRVRSVRSESVWVLGGWLAGTSLAGMVAWLSLIVIDTFWPEMEQPSHGVFVALSAPEAGIAIRVVTVLSAALVAPLGEELFFRGILQTTLLKVFSARAGSRYHRWWAIGVAGTLFGLMHYTTPQYIPPLIVLGMVLGYLYERRGSLATPVLVHMLFNVKSLLWYALQY